jgi:hypothetical protein
MNENRVFCDLLSKLLVEWETGTDVGGWKL